MQSVEWFNQSSLIIDKVCRVREAKFNQVEGTGLGLLLGIPSEPVSKNGVELKAPDREESFTLGACFLTDSWVVC